MQSEDRGKGIHYRQPAQQEEQILGRQLIDKPEIHAQANWQHDHLLGVVKRPAELAENQLFRRQIGHQE